MLLEDELKLSQYNIKDGYRINLLFKSAPTQDDNKEFTETTEKVGSEVVTEVVTETTTTEVEKIEVVP